jgi:hypothetical protein
MQPGLNFRATDKNVEQLVVVKEAALSAILRFGTLSANDAVVAYLRTVPAKEWRFTACPRCSRSMSA